MKNYIRKFGLSVIALLTLGVCVQAQDDLKIRPPVESDGTISWKFKPEQVLKIKIVQDVNMSVDVNGQLQEMVNNGVNELTQKVESVDSEGVASVSIVIDRMIVETEAPGVNMLIDTDNEEDYDETSAQIANVLFPMIGKSISQKMAPNGQISEVKIPEGMLDGIENGGAGMGQMFNEESIKEITSKSSLVFPENKLSVGDKWDDEATMSMGGANVTTETSYEYLGVADVEGTPLHIIKGKVKMSFPDGVQGMDVDVVDEDSSFIFYFDGNKGRLTKSELDQNMTMEIPFGAQVISQTLNQKMKMEITDEK